MFHFSKALKSPKQPSALNLRGTRRPDNAAERVAQYFDHDPAGYAEDYVHLNSPSAFFFRRRQAIVMDFLRSLKGGLIVDVGCGPGIYAKPCVDQGFRYYGLDVSCQMVNEGFRRFGNLAGAEFAVGDARQLPFPSRSVDAVLCLGMLEYVSQEQQTAYLNEMARVLKPGGIIIFSFLNASSPFWIWADYFLPPVKFLVKNWKAVLKNSRWIPFENCLANDLPARKFRFAERTRILRAAGLSVAESIYFSLNVFPAPLDARFPHQLFWVSSKLEFLLRIPLLKRLGMGFVIAAQKSISFEESEASAGYGVS